MMTAAAIVAGTLALAIFWSALVVAARADRQAEEAMLGIECEDCEDEEE